MSHRKTVAWADGVASKVPPGSRIARPVKGVQSVLSPRPGSYKPEKIAVPSGRRPSTSTRPQPFGASQASTASYAPVHGRPPTRYPKSVSTPPRRTSRIPSSHYEPYSPAVSTPASHRPATKPKTIHGSVKMGAEGSQKVAPRPPVLPSRPHNVEIWPKSADERYVIWNGWDYEVRPPAPPQWSTTGEAGRRGVKIVKCVDLTDESLRAPPMMPRF
eukprot:TRINITY_DN23396_c0_g1_i1.p1 TRINITY_DN23396_c0_g1~~TRINITY_DN23396_c0_g1_i1.p1  ORF type:complete len:237 (+),score=31.12 TRINITY_DN23396_c0_g1_i1:66-713(+)